MDRKEAKQQVVENWEPLIQRITRPARKKVNGTTSYICPFCKHGEHGDGLTINPRGKSGALKCFGCGFSGDIIDLYSKHYGQEFNDALNTAAAELGITIDPYKGDPAADFDINNLMLDDNAGMDNAPKPPAQNAPNSPDREKGKETPTETEKGAENGAGADYRAYYKACRQRLNDPAAESYLQARGISTATAAAYWIGYDPQADPANAPGAMGNEHKPHPVPRIIIPTSRAHYVGRSIDPATPKAFQKLNPNKDKGAGSPGIFNYRALYAKGARKIFVLEGAFDALSILEAGGSAIALNSKSNGRLLLDQLRREPPAGALGFIVCPDNDPNPKTNENTQKTAQQLCDDLRAAGYYSIVYNAAGEYKDANDALCGDRAAFEKAVIKGYDLMEEEMKKGAAQPLPGLLEYADIVKEFENADDETIEIKSFPQFSKKAKIKKHSTIALAADTGAGKSSLALNFLNDLNSEYPCIYFNLEMDRLTVLRRLVAIVSGLELDTIEGYRNDQQTAAAVNVCLKVISDRQPLQVIQDAYQLEQIEAIVKASTAGRTVPTIVFIDHSLLVEITGHVTGRYDRFTIISEKLRKMALKYNIVLFVLLQQSREGKKDETEPPKNSSLKESGSWENDSTHIVFLWYDPTAKRKKLIITKNRTGEQGEFTLEYWSRTQTYTEAKDQPAALDARNLTLEPNGKQGRRAKAEEKLRAAYRSAVVTTNGQPTLRAIAEAADVTTATVRGWIKEYGGCTVNGETVDPAGIDTSVEYTGFIKLTPADNAPDEITAPRQDQPRKII